MAFPSTTTNQKTIPLSSRLPEYVGSRCSLECSCILSKFSDKTLFYLHISKRRNMPTQNISCIHKYLLRLAVRNIFFSFVDYRMYNHYKTLYSVFSKQVDELECKAGTWRCFLVAECTSGKIFYPISVILSRKIYGPFCLEHSYLSFICPNFPSILYFHIEMSFCNLSAEDPRLSSRVIVSFPKLFYRKVSCAHESTHMGCGQLQTVSQAYVGHPPRSRIKSTWSCINPTSSDHEKFANASKRDVSLFPQTTPVLTISTPTAPPLQSRHMRSHCNLC